MSKIYSANCTENANLYCMALSEDNLSLVIGLQSPGLPQRVLARMQAFNLPEESFVDKV